MNMVIVKLSLFNVHVYALYADKATVSELIGLTFWKYTEETDDPVKLVSTNVVRGRLRAHSRFSLYYVYAIAQIEHE